MSDLNFEQLAEKCFINRTSNPQQSVSAVDELENSMSEKDFISVLNYFFEISNNYDVISHILKKFNKYKPAESVSVLADALVLKEKYKSKIKDSEIQTQIRIAVSKVLANIKNNAIMIIDIFCIASCSLVCNIKYVLLY